MKKLIIKNKTAFTLIELMTTLTIMAIIIIAAIPFAMKKDIQKRAVAGHIGVFECYYDKEGKLMQHWRSKDGSTSKVEPIPSGKTCKFNPNADYAKGAKNFQIIAIGGGGAGGTYNTQSSDTEVTNAVQHSISSTDTLDSSHIATLIKHGRLKFGTLSNAGGTNAWFWDGNTQTEQCYNDFWRSDCWCYGKNSYTSNTCYCSNPDHQDFKVTCRRTANSSNMDFVSVNNYGYRLCAISKNSDLLDNPVKEDDIFQAIHKYYGIGGSFPGGDIVYDIKAPSGLASCACLNDPVGGVDGSCMAGSIKSSVGGSAGVAYSYSTYTGKIRGAYMGNSFLTTDGSCDENAAATPSNHCNSNLKLAGTTFGCGTKKQNNECYDGSIRSGFDRGFPKIYAWGNSYNSNKKDPSHWYEQIDMSYTNREGSLADYGGDVHFRLVSNAGNKAHAIIPSGAHGSDPYYGGVRVQAASSPVNSNFDGFISGRQGFYSSNNASGACGDPPNTYSATASRIWKVKGSCEGSCTYKSTCGSGSNAYTCWPSEDCADSTDWAEYYPNETQQSAYKSVRNNCLCTCGTSTNNEKQWTDSKGTCEHLNCCNNYNKGSKKYTVRYHTGTSFTNTQSTGTAEVDNVERTVNCGDHLYVYRQIKQVPFERAFVASAGQNGTIKQASYPKIDETLVLEPGIGGKVGGTIAANGTPSTVRRESGQIIVNATGGLKGSSDKLNDTWVGPCMLFSLRESFDEENPGCMSRHDVMRKPIYNALLMSNAPYLKSTGGGVLDSEGATTNGVKLTPGLGGNGAYANVFPDRFLFSKAIRDQVRMTTNYIGPKQSQNWKTNNKDDELTFIGLDTFTTPEFIGSSKVVESFASSFHKRLSKLGTASSNFLNKDNRRNGRVPNFMEATNGNNGAIVIIW